jgi:hypothetical protein
MDVEACLLRHHWNLRARSPHTLFGDLRGVVEELGYKVNVSEPFQVEESAISDEATLKGQFEAQRQVGERFVRAQGGLGALSLLVAFALLGLGFMGPIEVADGVVIGVGFVLIMAGVALVATAFQSRTQLLVVVIEGRGRRPETHQRNGFGATDIVADVRIVAGTSTALFAGGTEIEGPLALQRADILDRDFKAFRDGVDDMLPAYTME